MLASVGAMVPTVPTGGREGFGMPGELNRQVAVTGAVTRLCPSALTYQFVAIYWVSQPRTWALMAPASPARSVALRRLRCQSLICLPIAFFALGLMAGEKLTKKASSATGPPTTEGVAEKVEAGVLRLITAVRVFAVHDLRLVGMQLKAQNHYSRSTTSAQSCWACCSVSQQMTT